MKLNRYLYSIAIIGILLFSGACKKQKLNKSTDTTADYARAEFYFHHMYKLAEEVILKRDSSIYYSFSPCATVSISPDWDSPIFPKTLRITFANDSLCNGNDAFEREGEIVVTLFDEYENEGSVTIVQSNGFKVGTKTIAAGTITSINKGVNASNQPVFDFEIADGRITYSWSKRITFQCERERTWTAGYLTSTLEDNEFELTGLASGTDESNRYFTVKILTPLEETQDCDYIQGGTADLRPDELKTRILNYGNLICDNRLTVQIGNESYLVLVLED